MTANHCPEELTDKSDKCSPGLVADGEKIVLILFDPETVSNGKLTATTISRKRLKKVGEFSVARAAYVSADVAQREIVDKRTSNDPKLQFIGAAVALAGEIRATGVSESLPRLFCVFDDPIAPDLCGHAVITFSAFTRADKFWEKKSNDALAATGNLLILFEKSGVPLDLKDCFP